MAVLKVHNFRCRRELPGHQRITSRQCAIVPSQRWCSSNPLCTLSELPRSYQLYIRRTLHMAVPPRALLQGWRTTPRLQLRGITAPLVLLGKSRSGTAGENTIMHPKIGPGHKGLCPCSWGTRNANKTVYCRCGKLPDGLCPPSSPSARGPWRSMSPATAESSPSADVKEEVLYCEEDIGAGAFVARRGTRRGLRGTMRYRSEDFVVREIGGDGWVCEFPASEGCAPFVDLCEEDYRGNVCFHQEPLPQSQRGRLPSVLLPEHGTVLQRSSRHSRQSAGPGATCDERSLQKKSEKCSRVLAPVPGSAQSSEETDDFASCCTGLALNSFTKSAERFEARTRACTGEDYSFKFVLGKRNRETPEALEMIARATGIPRECFSFAGMKDRRAVTLQWVSCTLPRSLSLSNVVGRIPLPTSCRGVAGKESGLTVIPGANEAGSEEVHRQLPSPQATVDGSAAKQSPSAVSRFAPLKHELCPEVAPCSRAGATDDVPPKRVDFLHKHTRVQCPSNVRGSPLGAPACDEEKGRGVWNETPLAVKELGLAGVSVCAKKAELAADTGSCRYTATNFSNHLDCRSAAVGGSGVLYNSASAAPLSTVGECSDDRPAFATSRSRPANPRMSPASCSLLKGVKEVDAVEVVGREVLYAASTVLPVLEGRAGKALQAEAVPRCLRPPASTAAMNGFSEIRHSPEEVVTSESRHTVARSAVEDPSDGGDEEGCQAYRATSDKTVESHDSAREPSTLQYDSNSRESTQGADSGAGLPERACLSVVQMANFAKRAMAHPSWDPCVSWGSFRPGRVYLGGLKGNSFTILLRNVQITPLVKQAVPLGKTAQPVLSTGNSCVKKDVRTPRHAAKRESVRAGDHAGEWRKQKVSEHGEKRVSVLPRLHERADAAGVQGCTDEEDTFLEAPRIGELDDDHAALLEEVRGAATTITEKGFVNYFGPQRFGTGAHPTFHIGRALLRRQHNLVCHLIVQIPATKFCEAIGVDGATSATASRASRSAHRSTSSTLESGSTGVAQGNGASAKAAVSKSAAEQDAQALTGASTTHSFSSCSKDTATCTWSSQLSIRLGGPDMLRVAEDSEGSCTEALCTHREGSFTGLQESTSFQQKSAAAPPFSEKSGNYAVPSEHQRAYAAAQDAYWQGDFWRAYTLLPKRCRLERQLLRQLAASPYVQDAASRRHAVFDEREVEDLRKVMSGDEGIYPCESDLAECVNATELAAAAGAATEGAGRRAAALAEREVAGSSFSVSFKRGMPATAAISTELVAAASERGSFRAEESAAVRTNWAERNTSSRAGEDRRECLFCRGGGAALAPRHAVRRAITALPRLQRLMFVKAYAAYLWNKCATERVRLYGADHAVPGDLVLMAQRGSSGATVPVKNNEIGRLCKTAGVSGSQTWSRCLGEGDGTNSRVRILTKEDCAEFRARDVVLPLIGVGAVLPRNAVGDYMVALLKKEGLTESLYRRESEYFLDVVYRPVLSHPRDFECELLRLPPDFPGVVPDHFFKSQRRNSTTSDAVSKSAATQSGHEKLWTHVIQNSAASQSASKQDPTTVWSFNVAEARGSGSEDKEGPQGRSGKSSSCGGRAAECVSFSRTTSTDAMSSRISTSGERERDAPVTCVASRRGCVKQRRTQWSTCSVSGTADGESIHCKSGTSTFEGRNETGAQQGLFGLLLRFTLDAGVFASSALREFMHCPFPHPFTQRRREKRNLPGE